MLIVEVFPYCIVPFLQENFAICLLASLLKCLTVRVLFFVFLNHVKVVLKYENMTLLGKASTLVALGLYTLFVQGKNILIECIDDCLEIVLRHEYILHYQ
uniref:Uncharacterized protein n=1 Tax=Sphaerodactylus townsendi TaxID=933632 RepID=A0ACB8FMP8_9SAUR